MPGLAIFKIRQGVLQGIMLFDWNNNIFFALNLFVLGKKKYFEYFCLGWIKIKVLVTIAKKCLNKSDKTEKDA